MRRFLVSGLFLAATVALVSCGSSAGASNKSTSGAAPNAQAVTVKGNDQMKFDPASITVKAGTPVRVTLDDGGTALAHDFTIDDIDGKKFQVTAQPNGRANGEFTPSAVGNYQFYCSQPGHKEVGMVGTLVVTE